MISAHKLIEIRKSLGFNQADFSRKIGYSREVVSKIENGKMEASKWFAEAVQSYLDRRKLAGHGPDVKILGKISHRPDARSYVEQRREQKNETSVYWVPLVAIKVQAGYVKSFEQTDFLESLEKYSLPPGVNPSGAIWRYFEIDGDSMEPELNAGDVVLATMVPAEDWNEIRDNQVYVIHTSDQLLIKRIVRRTSTEWILVSDNEEYPQVTMHPEHVRQLWFLRRHIRSKVPPPRVKNTA